MPNSLKLPLSTMAARASDWIRLASSLPRDGVDLTLIEWTLSLTPRERLDLLQDWVDGLAELRNGRIAER